MIQLLSLGISFLALIDAMEHRKWVRERSIQNEQKDVIHE